MDDQAQSAEGQPMRVQLPQHISDMIAQDRIVIAELQYQNGLLASEVQRLRDMLSGPPPVPENRAARRRKQRESGGGDPPE